jgi:hypothetical protein
VGLSSLAGGAIRGKVMGRKEVVLRMTWVVLHRQPSSVTRHGMIQLDTAGHETTRADTYTVSTTASSNCSSGTPPVQVTARPDPPSYSCGFDIGEMRDMSTLCEIAR